MADELDAPLFASLIERRYNRRGVVFANVIFRLRYDN